MRHGKLLAIAGIAAVLGIAACGDRDDETTAGLDTGFAAPGAMGTPEAPPPMGTQPLPPVDTTLMDTLRTDTLRP